MANNVKSSHHHVCLQRSVLVMVGQNPDRQTVKQLLEGEGIHDGKEVVDSLFPSLKYPMTGENICVTGDSFVNEKDTPELVQLDTGFGSKKAGS